MALLGALQPLFTALYLVTATRARLGMTTWMGLLIGFAGVAGVLAPKLAAGGTESITLASTAFALLGQLGLVTNSRGFIDNTSASGAAVTYTAPAAPPSRPPPGRCSPTRWRGAETRRRPA